MTYLEPRYLRVLKRSERPCLKIRDNGSNKTNGSARRRGPTWLPPGVERARPYPSVFSSCEW